MEVSPHTLSLQQTLKGVETKLQFLGPGPHGVKQAEEFQTLTKVKQNLLEQIKASVQDKPSQPLPSPKTTASAIVQQATPLSAPTTSLTMPQTTRTTLVSKLPPQQHQQIILTKPRPPAPQFIIQTPTENETKILNKQRLQELIKEIDPTEQLDDDVEEMLMQITDDFIESVVSASCNLAKHRKSNTLEVKDLKLHLENQWNITVPGYSSDEVRQFKKSTSTDAHKQRLALIRKATKK